MTTQPKDNQRRGLENRILKILAGHDKQVADRKRGFQIETQDYFTKNRILTEVDTYVAEQITDFCQGKTVMENFVCGEHGKIKPEPCCPKCLSAPQPRNDEE